MRLRLSKVVSANTPIIKKWRSEYAEGKTIYAYRDKFIAPIMLNQVFLKKLITGPPIVPDNQDKIFVRKLLFPSLFLIISTVFFEIKFSL